MSKVKHIKAKDVTFEAFGGPPGEARIARLISTDLSSSMGGGIAVFDGCSIEWTLLYDEIIYVIEGRFRLRYGKGHENVIEAGPGDVIWLPDKTPLKYEGEKAKVFYTVHPVDWKKRAGLA